MFGITNFRWFTDDRTQRIRDAQQADDAASDALEAYANHYRETHPRDYRPWTPEHNRLNTASWETGQELRRAQGKSYYRIERPTERDA